MKSSLHDVPGPPRRSWISGTSSLRPIVMVDQIATLILILILIYREFKSDIRPRWLAMDVLNRQEIWRSFQILRFPWGMLFLAMSCIVSVID